MPTSHDLHQDQHLADLDSEMAQLRKRINSNLHIINKVAKDVNDRLAKLETSGQDAPAPARRPSRRKKPGKGASIK